MKSISKYLNVSTFALIISPLLSLPIVLSAIYNKKRNFIFYISFFYGILVYLFIPREDMDSAGRYFLYEFFLDQSFSDFLTYIGFRVDYIFYYLIYLFAYYKIKFQLLLFFFGFISVYIPLKIFEKLFNKDSFGNKSFLLVILFILSAISLQYVLSGIRQLLGFNLILISLYQFYFKKKYMSSFLFYVFGLFTHFSCALFLPIVIILKFFNQKFIILTVIAVFLITIFGGNFLQTTLFDFFSVNDNLLEKVNSYAITDKDTSSSSSLTLLALFLKNVWVPFSVIFYFRNKADNRFSSFFLTALIPLVFFFAYPSIWIRYADFLKLVFSYYFIYFLVYKNIDKNWFSLFFLLYIFEPLYTIFRVLTNSIIVSYFDFSNLTIYGILNKTTLFKDVLPI